MVETFDVSITPYGLTRRTFVYLPDDWQTSGKKYPVLYMFDGHNLFFDSTATYGTCWGLKEYCDAHPNWIIAAPECNHEGNKRLEEYCPYQSDWFGGITGTGHEYMEWLTKEFKPMMDKRYPTLPGRANTAIGGSSMGGLMSLYALLQYNDTFSRAAACRRRSGCLLKSSAVWWAAQSWSPARCSTWTTVPRRWAATRECAGNLPRCAARSWSGAST